MWGLLWQGQRSQPVSYPPFSGKWAALWSLSFIFTIYGVIFNGKNSVSWDFYQTSCASNWMQKAGMFFKVKIFFPQTSVI